MVVVSVAYLAVDSIEMKFLAVFSELCLNSVGNCLHLPNFKHLNIKILNRFIVGKGLSL